MVVLRPAPLRPEPVREFEQAVDHRGAREAIDPRPEVEEIPDVFEEADAEVFVLANTELDGGREAVKGFGELMCFDRAACVNDFAGRRQCGSSAAGRFAPSGGKRRPSPRLCVASWSKRDGNRKPCGIGPRTGPRLAGDESLTTTKLSG